MNCMEPLVDEGSDKKNCQKNLFFSLSKYTISEIINVPSQ